MKTKFITAIFLFNLLFIKTAFTQQNPSGIDWKKIDTGTYEIIFPEEITPLGQRVANLMVHYEKYNYSSIKTEPRKIPIVLINQYAEPNGFVSPAPFYSHWFTTPSSFDSIEWFKGLAIHEGRHMVQMNKLNDGFGKGAWRLLLGDMGSALFSGIYVPQWFFEGDAVLMETALTPQGRGRLPYFNLWQRALELSGKKRDSYYQSYLGSYDALLPYSDHYRLGYILCSYVRKHYGKESWNRILEDTGRYFLFYTFNTSLIHETGKSIPELYDAALNEYRLLWDEQQKTIPVTEAQILNGTGSKWNSFLFPSVNTRQELTAVKFNRDNRLSLVKINTDREYEIIKQVPFEIASGFLTNERVLTSGGDFFLWKEGVPDPRWGYRSYSELTLLNTVTGKTEYISNKGKFIASALSSDGKQAAGIEYGPDLKYFLSVIDTSSRKIVLREEITDKGYLFDPAFSSDGKNIAFVSLTDNGYALLQFNTESKKISNIIDYTNNERLRAPVYYGKFVIYGSDYSGIDNIYAVDLKTKKRFQVTSRPLGAYFPFIKNNILFFNDYSVSGYNAASMVLAEKQFIPLEKVKRNTIDYINSITDQELEGDNNRIENIPETVYPVKNYYPALNVINPFGWIPYFDSTTKDFSFILASRDILHTTDMLLMFTRNFNEKKSIGEASVVYSGFYPVLELSASHGGRAVYLENKETDEVSYSTWNETRLYTGFSIPLDFSVGIHSINVNAGTEGGYLNISNKNIIDYRTSDNIKKDGKLIFAKYYLKIANFSQSALNSVSPGPGQSFSISYYHTPSSGDFKGSMFSAEMKLFFTGLTDTHGLEFSGSYEKTEYKTYAFPQEFLFPRGYDSVRQSHLYKGTVDYSFPIVNFSANIWKLIYFKRINGDIFFDCGAGSSENYKFNKENKDFNYYRSAGFELTAEHNLLANRFLELEAGLRYSRCFDADEDADRNNDKERYEIVLRTPLGGN